MTLVHCSPYSALPTILTAIVLAPSRSGLLQKVIEKLVTVTSKSDNYYYRDSRKSDNLKDRESNKEMTQRK